MTSRSLSFTLNPSRIRNQPPRSSHLVRRRTLLTIFRGRDLIFFGLSEPKNWSPCAMGHSTRTHVSRVRLVVPREVTSSSRGTWRAFIGFTRLAGGGKTFGPCDYCEPTSTGGCCNSSSCSWDEVNRVERERKTNGRQLERLKCVEGGRERKRDREGESESRWLARRTGRCTTSSEKVRRRVWLSSWMSNVRRYRRTFVLNVHHALRQRLHISMKK